MPAPMAAAEEGWIPVDPFPDIRGTFLAGGADERIRVAYFRRPDADELHARAWFGILTKGPPGHVHGGAIAAVLDEAMGAVCWMNGHPTVAAQITVTFVGMLPLESETTAEARIESVDGRKVRSRATLKTARGDTVAEARGLFVILKDETWRSLNDLGRT